MSIENAYVELELAREAWQEALGLLSQGKWDFTAKKAVLENLSLEDYDRRVLGLFEIFDEIHPTDPGLPGWAAMFSKSVEIKERLTHLKNHAKSVADQVRPHMRETMTLNDSNGNFAIQFIEGGAAITNWDASATFREITSAVNTLIQYVAMLLPICKVSGIADMSARAKALADTTREAEAARTEAKRLAKDSEKSAALAAEKAKLAEDSLSNAQTSESKAQATQQTIQQDYAAITALIQQIKTTGAAADTLEQQVAGYKAKFDAFQIQMGERLDQFAEFEKSTIAAVEANGKREAEIDRLIEASDKMIKGSTTAGLAHSMEDTRKRYEERMKDARIGFYIAVAFLLVSTLPLIVHLLPGFFADWIPSLGPKTAGDPWEILGKVILMVPATWLTVFFNKSYTEFFHLEREYAHKAALAMSVEGFRRQAKKYDEEIAAEVFMEIRSNPGDRPSPEPASHPLYDILAKKVFEFVSKDKKAN
jgi:hypothetical protein